MEFTDANLRFGGKLLNGDLCVCKLFDNVNWNQTGVALGVYYDGQFYDAQVKEDDTLPHSVWGMYDENSISLVKEYAFTGVNVENLISPVSKYYEQI